MPTQSLPSSTVFAIYIGRVIFAWLLLLLPPLSLPLLHAFYICEHVYSLKTCQFNIFLCMIIITTFPCFASHSNDVRCVCSFYSLLLFKFVHFSFNLSCCLTVVDCFAWALIFDIPTVTVDYLVCTIALAIRFCCMRFFFSFGSVATFPSRVLAIRLDADFILHTKPYRAIIQFFNFIAFVGVCARLSMQVNECVNRVLFQVAWVTMHNSRSQATNQSKTISCMQRCCNDEDRCYNALLNCETRTNQNIAVNLFTMNVSDHLQGTTAEIKWNGQNGEKEKWEK